MMDTLMKQDRNNRVSVLLSVYKAEKPEYLREALLSIINQTEMADEIVVVKDGPLTSELDYQLNEVKDNSAVEFKVVELEHNYGLGMALQFGLKHCKGDLIVRMDTDDIAVPDRIEIQKEYMSSHPDVSAVGGYIDEFIETPDNPLRNKKMPVGFQNIKQYAKYRNPINHMTVCFRKRVIENVGSYEHFPLFEDYHLWSRLLANGKIIDNIPKVLVHARISEGFATKRGGREYYKTYQQLRKIQYKLGLTNIFEYIIASVGTAMITLSSSKIRETMYKNLFRK